MLSWLKKAPTPIVVEKPKAQKAAALQAPAGVKRLSGAVSADDPNSDQPLAKLPSGGMNGFASPSQIVDAKVTPEEKSDVLIESIDQLPRFKGYLASKVALAEHLRTEICPLATNHDGTRCILIMTLQHGGTRGLALSEEADEVVKTLAKRGIVVEQVHHAVALVLLQLVRETVVVIERRSGARAMKDQQRVTVLFQQFTDVVNFAYKLGANDIHFKPLLDDDISQIRFRVYGICIDPLEYQMPTKTVIDMLAAAYQQSSGGDGAGINWSIQQQCRVEVRVEKSVVTLRWASAPLVNGLKVVTRLMRKDVVDNLKTLDDAGYLPDQVRVIKKAVLSRGGMILLAGVVGSGKSTTAHICLKMLPSWMESYTVEDPVEIVDKRLSQIQVNRSVAGSDEDDAFIAVKRTLKRLDLDAALLGEIRDRQTANVAIDIAKSGHRVFGTVHALSCVGVLPRLADESVGVAMSDLAFPGIFKLSIFQTLVPTLCECAYTGADAIRIIESSDATADVRMDSADGTYLGHVASLFKVRDMTKISARNEAGCPKCAKGYTELNGLSGRIVAAELFVMNDLVRDAVSKGDFFGVYKAWRSQRVAPFDEPGSAGKTAQEVALYWALQGRCDLRMVESMFDGWPVDEVINEHA